MTIGANVSRSDIEGLESLLYSIDVKMLLNPDTWIDLGAQWTNVIIAKGSYKLYETDYNTTDIELSIILPSINIQSR